MRYKIDRIACTDGYFWIGYKQVRKDFWIFHWNTWIEMVSSFSSTFIDCELKLLHSEKRYGNIPDEMGILEFSEYVDMGNLY